MKKIIIENLSTIFMVSAVAGLFLFAGHLAYMKATSGVCVTELPAKYIVHPDGEDFKVRITRTCQGGLLFKPPELNQTQIKQYYGID